MLPLNEPTACWRFAAQQWANHTPCVVVCVAATRGSAPRRADAVMLVTAAHSCGTIGGGHLELLALDTARAALLALSAAPHSTLPKTIEYPLGAALGQCCGGAVTLSFALLSDAHLRQFEQAAMQLQTVYLCGAGHVARALAAQLAALPVRLHWLESRDAITGFDSAFPEAFLALPTVHCSLTDTPEAELASAPTGSAVLVMTHSHSLDETLVAAALRHSAFSFIGLIGSATKRKKFEQRLSQRGITPAQFAKVVCPIGVPNIVGKSPAVIALSVAAQLAQHWGW